MILNGQTAWLTRADKFVLRTRLAWWSFMLVIAAAVLLFVIDLSVKEKKLERRAFFTCRGGLHWSSGDFYLRLLSLGNYADTRFEWQYQTNNCCSNRGDESSQGKIFQVLYHRRAERIPFLLF